MIETPIFIRPFVKYARFAGRSSRLEYWLYHLFVIPSGVVVRAIAETLNDEFGTKVFLLLWVAFQLGILLPSIAVGIRRMHDSDRSGWNALWGLTGIGIFWAFYLLVRPGSSGPNRYGPPVAEGVRETAMATSSV